jgi:hypothetical protein
LDLSYVVALRFEVAPDKSETSLVSNAIIVFAFVLNELAAILVDCIVCEMHEKIIEVVMVWRHILFCRESGESFSVNVYSKRVHATKEDVDSEIEF